MIYLDTNILIYAFCKNTDNEKQKELAQEILKSAISQEKLLLSDVSLCEFAFVSKKLQESDAIIKLNLDFLTQFVKNASMRQKLVDVMQESLGYQHSFDVYHVCFANHFNCSQLITYDRGFKKFFEYSKTPIKIADDGML